MVFAGTMGPAQNLRTVLEAARLIQSSDPAIEFVFVGDGLDRPALVAEAERQGLDNVRFFGRRPPGEMGPILAGADALLVHLSDDPLFRVTIPSKTQAYLAAGRPLVMAVAGDAADLVRAAGAGITCEPDDPEGLAAAVRRLARMPADEREALGRRGRAFYDSELSLGAGVSRFERLFERLTRSSAASRPTGKDGPLELA